MNIRNDSGFESKKSFIFCYISNSFTASYYTMRKLTFALTIGWAIYLGGCSSVPPGPPKAATPALVTQLPYKPIPLTNLEAFEKPDANWAIAGNAYADLNEDKGAITGSKGTGVLINNPTDAARGNLFTQLQHGDIELDITFMVPKGSNSGIYLQGRYEVQILDSWGKENPGFGDCGGIYQRWEQSEAEGQRGFEGHGPRINASRAPGLWQHFRIRFQAPRFDENGMKTANAKFLSVVHNGVEIHKDVEVTGPTRAAAFEDEKPTGPVMIQGDHGPVAFKNMGYKRYSDQGVALGNMKYQLYELPSIPNDTDYLPDFASLTPDTTLHADSLSRNITEMRRNFAMMVDGTLNTPESGRHLFEMRIQGGGKLLIDGKLVIDHDGEHEYAESVAYGMAELTAGEHNFQFLYRKQHRAWKNGIALYAEGPNMPRHALHAPGSPMPMSKAKPFILNTDSEPSLLRGYVDHKDIKHTHTISVGDPGGIHYSYDLNQNALLSIWGGPFVDVTEMWVGRGIEQKAVPQGATISLSGKPSFARLANNKAAWPDSVDGFKAIRFSGYKLSESGFPAYQYKIGNTKIADYISPEKVRKLVRKISISGDPSPQDLYLLLASGSSIEELPNGSYGIDGLSYYLELDNKDALKPVIRQSKGQSELILPLSGHSSVQYALIW